MDKLFKGLGGKIKDAFVKKPAKEEISEEDWNKFIDTGLVPDTILEKIAQKIMGNKTLNNKETTIYQSNNTAIEKILKDAKDSGSVGASPSNVTLAPDNLVPTPEIEAQKEVKDFIAQFGIDAAWSPEFNNLDDAQKLKVVNDLKLRSVDIIKSNAQTQYSDYLKSKMASAVPGSNKWGTAFNKIGVGIKNVGTRMVEGAKKEYKLKALEKEVLQGLLNSDEGKEQIAKDFDLLTKHTAQREVTLRKNGEMYVRYTSKEEFEKLSDEEKILVVNFDKVANNFQNMPYEWGQGKGKNKKAYDKAEAEYRYFRYDLLKMKEEKGNKAKAMLEVGQIDNAIKMEQILFTHPEFHQALSQIADTPAGMKWLDSASKTTGNFLHTITGGKTKYSNWANKIAFGTGFVIRGGTRLATGILTGTMPAKTAYAVSTSVGLIAAPIFGAAFGAIKGNIKAKETLRKNKEEARHGKKDESKEARNTVDSASLNKRFKTLTDRLSEIQNNPDTVSKHVKVGDTLEMDGRMLRVVEVLPDGKVSVIELESHKWEASEYPEYPSQDYWWEKSKWLASNASEFSGKTPEEISHTDIEEFEKKRNQSKHRIDTPLEGAVPEEIKKEDVIKFLEENLLDQIKRRVEYAQDKIEQGLVNFGNAKEVLSNQLSLMENLNQAMVAAASLEESTRKDVDEALESFLDRKELRIDQAQKKFIKTQMKQAAMVGAGAGMLGYITKWVGDETGLWKWAGEHMPWHHEAAATGAFVPPEAKGVVDTTQTVAPADSTIVAPIDSSKMAIDTSNNFADTTDQWMADSLGIKADSMDMDSMASGISATDSMEVLAQIKQDSIARLKSVIPLDTLNKMNPDSLEVLAQMKADSLARVSDAMSADSLAQASADSLKALENMNADSLNNIKAALDSLSQVKQDSLLNMQADSLTKLSNLNVDSIKTLTALDSTQMQTLLKMNADSLATLDSTKIANLATLSQDSLAKVTSLDSTTVASLAKLSAPDLQKTVELAKDAVDLKEQAQELVKNLDRGIKVDFEVTLGKNGVPPNLETVFNEISADHMEIPTDGKVTEEFATKSLNMAANLVKLTEGHSVAGMDAKEFANAVEFKNGVLNIKDHVKFNQVISELQKHADENWESGILQSKGGAITYIPKISHNSWLKIVHADGMHEDAGGVHTGIEGHQEITKDQIMDFKNSEMVKKAIVIEETNLNGASDLYTAPNQINPNATLLDNTLKAPPQVDPTKTLGATIKVPDQVDPTTGLPQKTIDNNPSTSALDKTTLPVEAGMTPELTKLVQETYENHVSQLFKTEADLTKWNFIKTSRSADNLMSMSEDRVKDIFKPFVHYLHDLRRITGLEPISGNSTLGIKAESNEEYVKRALAWATQNKKLGEIEIAEIPSHGNSLDHIITSQGIETTGTLGDKIFNTYSDNIDNIFYKEGTLHIYQSSDGTNPSIYGVVKNESAVDWLKTGSKNKIPPLSDFADFIDKIHKVTGLKPIKETGDVPAETTDMYIKRALNWAGLHGKLNEFQVEEAVKPSASDDVYYDPDKFKK